MVYIVHEGKPVRIDDKTIFTQCDGCGSMIEESFTTFISSFVEMCENAEEFIVPELIEGKTYCNECSIRRKHEGQEE